MKTVKTPEEILKQYDLDHQDGRSYSIEATKAAMEEYAAQFREGKDEDRAAIELLKEYEQWEADLISEDKLWWPHRANDVLRGPLYDKMMELQAKRNEILSQDRAEGWIAATKRLPAVDENVLMCDGEDVFEGYICSRSGLVFRANNSYQADDCPDRFTHWQPLPKAPLNQ